MTLYLPITSLMVNWPICVHKSSFQKLFIDHSWLKSTPLSECTHSVVSKKQIHLPNSVWHLYASGLDNGRKTEKRICLELPACGSYAWSRPNSSWTQSTCVPVLLLSAFATAGYKSEV